MRRLRISGTAVLILGAAWLVIRGGRFLVVDEPRRADTILVLAGETDRRPARAVELLQQGYARTLILDVPAAARIYTFTQLELAERYVQTLPEASAIRVCPIIGQSTRDEAHDAEECLAAEHAQNVVIVTSDFHTRRALSIFRHEVPSRSFSVVAAHDERQFAPHWWKRRQWAKTAVDEWLRLLWWNAVDRWR